MGINATQCEYCSRPETDYSYVDSSQTAYTRESELPVIGGILILIAGVLGVFWGLLLMASIASIGDYDAGGSTCCSGLFCLFGLIAIAGSFSAIGRNSVTFAVIGGVFGILSLGFFIGALLALIGVILVAIAHNEFSN